MYSPTPICTPTSSNGLSFCSSHKYGSSWRSATPPSDPSCVPAVCQHSCSTGRNCLSPWGRHCLPEGSLTSPAHPHRCHPALHIRDSAALGALGLPSHTWGWLQNHSVGLRSVVYACNALDSNTCHLITQVVIVQNFWGYFRALINLLQAASQLSISIIFCNLEPFI